MAKSNIKKDLDARSIVASGELGWHQVEPNLYVRVRSKGVGYYVYRYTSFKKTVEIGLGNVLEKELKSIKAIALRMSEAIIDGRNPRDEVEEKFNPTSATLEDYSKIIIEKIKPDYSLKHIKDLERAAKNYIYPKLGKMQPKHILPTDIAKALKPIWTTKNHTAVDCLKHIERAYIQWQIAANDYSLPNPAAWKNAPLSQLLPSPSRVRKVKHHPAVHYSQIPAIVTALKGRERLSSAQCLRFLILTCTRSGEARGATWGEVDLAAKVWTIPAERMKKRVEHKVPLSTEAIELLKAVRPDNPDPGGLIFHGRGRGQLTDRGLIVAAHAVSAETSVHGFRSSFRDWCAECTNFPFEVVEMALAHNPLTSTQYAYYRVTALPVRVGLMQAWSNHCNGLKQAKGKAEAEPAYRANDHNVVQIAAGQ